MSKIFCFKCGEELTAENTTREHIPAKTFYNGLPDEYKKQLLTIPACRRCNELHSKTDAVMRDAIGIMNDHNVLHNELTRKAVSSILRSSQLERLKFDENNKVIGVQFDTNDFEDLATKSHYGIFYQKYQLPLPEYFQTQVAWHGHTYNQVAAYEEEMIAKYGWNYIGHPDVFRYQIQDLHATDDGQVYSTGELDGSLMVASVMEFYRQFKFYGLSVKTDFLKQEAEKRGLKV